MRGVGLVQLEDGGVPLTVAHHHHGDLVFARSTRGPGAAAHASRPGQATLPLEGLQEKGFIGSGDAALTRIAMPGSGAKKAVPPQEGRVLVDAANPFGLFEREAIDQGLGVGLPAIGFAQMRQGAACQCIAGAATGAASVTPQAPAPAPRSQLSRRRLAMRASRQVRQAPFKSIPGRGRFMKRTLHGSSLRGIEMVQLRQPVL